MAGFAVPLSICIETALEPVLISPVMTTPEAFSSALITPSSAIAPKKGAKKVGTGMLSLPALSVAVAVILMLASFSCAEGIL